MAISDLSIVNRALISLGQTILSAIATGTDLGNIVYYTYPQVRDEVLRSYPWNCATLRQYLGAGSTISDAASAVYGYEYTLSGCAATPLRILELQEETHGDYVWKYERDDATNMRLLSDAPEANIRYIGQIAADYIDVHVAEAIAAKLAAEIAYNITGSSQKSAEMYEKSKQTLKKAKNIDAQEGTPDNLVKDTWLNARL